MDETHEQRAWRPAAEIEAEVVAAMAAAGEVLAADSGDPGDPGDEPTENPDMRETMLVEQVMEPAAGEDVPAPRAQASPPVFGAPPDPAPTSPTNPGPAPSPAPGPAPAGSGPTPEQISRHIARAEALSELGRRQQALDVLNELIVSGCEDVRVWRALAGIYLETGDGEKALRAADWVVTFAPGDEWGHRLRASALRLLDRPAEAVSAAEQAVELGPDVWQSRASLAAALEASGDLSQAAEEARKAAAMAAELDPDYAPEARQFEEAVTKSVAEVQAPGGLVADLEAVLASRPGPDDESLAHVGSLVLRSMEFSAAAGWLVAFGGVAIPGFNIRFLIPLAVLLVLGVFLVGPARKAGRDLWRYLVEYLWQDAKTRTALIMTVAAHVWMITGSSIGHLQGGSTLTVGLLSHLIGRGALHRKAPELSPVKRGGGGAARRPRPRARRQPEPLPRPGRSAVGA
ncbi:tetratricopeptide repeat protein [Catenulispora yoronensis]